MNDPQNKANTTVPSHTTDKHATVYYDGHCPLCSQEIARLEQQSQTMEFRDIHSQQALPFNKQELLQELHVITKDGQNLKGLDANIFMWRNSSHKGLGIVLSLPFIYPIANWLYNHWAKRRYAKRYTSTQTHK